MMPCVLATHSKPSSCGSPQVPGHASCCSALMRVLDIQHAASHTYAPPNKNQTLLSLPALHESPKFVIATAKFYSNSSSSCFSTIHSSETFYMLLQPLVPLCAGLSGSLIPPTSCSNVTSKGLWHVPATTWPETSITGQECTKSYI